jgi:transcriptional accessory protein Tex/SPT6
MTIIAVDKSIGGENYTITQMTARRALRMKARLFKLLGPAISEILAGGRGNFLDHLPKAAQILTSNMDDQNIEDIVLELLKDVRKNGREITPSVFDLEFAGCLDLLYRVIWEILEVNYKGFFEMCSIGGLFQADSLQQDQDSDSTKKTYPKRSPMNSQFGS